MKQPLLKGKAPIKKIKSAGGNASKCGSEKDHIERIVAREQIELFCKIVRNELPKKIADIDQLRRKEFNYDGMKQKCLTGEAELKRHFVELNSRAEVEAYQAMYTLADLSSSSFLFPNGFVHANLAVDNLVKVLMEQLEDLQRMTTECTFALELAVPPYEKRSAFEYSLLQDIRNEFVHARQWAVSQHTVVESQVLDFHAKEMISIACNPQYEDRRKAFIRSEKKQLKELITVINYLFFVCMGLLGVVCKNGDKLGLLLTKTHANL